MQEFASFLYKSWTALHPIIASFLQDTCICKGYDHYLAIFLQISCTVCKNLAKLPCNEHALLVQEFSSSKNLQLTCKLNAHFLAHTKYQWLQVSPNKTLESCKKSARKLYCTCKLIAPEIIFLAYYGWNE